MRNGGWDHEAFKHYVRQAAANLPGVTSQADIARAIDVAPSLLSKWFRGEERPSLDSLKKITKLPGVKLDDLMKLAGHSDDTETVVEPPALRVVHPIARRLDDLLAEGSPIPEADRTSLEVIVGRLLEPYEKLRGRRRTG